MAIGDPTGEDLCSKSFNASTLTDLIGDYSDTVEVTFDTSAVLEYGGKYAIIVRTDSEDEFDWIEWGQHTENAYADGLRCYSTDSSVSWTQYPTRDNYFVTKASGVVKDSNSGEVASILNFYGSSWAAQTFVASSTYTITSVILKLWKRGAGTTGTVTVSIRSVDSVVTISERATIKRLVAVGNNDVYYEDLDVAAGTMTELAAADGDIDTSDQLNMFEAYQKVFIVNGANLKVADFVNTKLTSDAEITTYLPSHGDILTQDQTGNKYAYMVVDFISAWAGGAHLIYGYAYYAGGATAFTTTHDVKDADGNTVIANANLTTVTAKPHWYDWTVYNGDTSTYGTMPNKAYLGCLYHGRTIISGDPEHPNQWYMARQANPWDWAYLAGDAGTPVKGQAADAGKLGDIIRCLIPYKDDYLTFGCVTSIDFLSGDPAYSGDLGSLDKTTGMFGSNSYCWDGAGNLYFWGTNGFYKTTIPGVPICLSAIALPNLVKDEAADPSTYRITMAYDRKDYGILICITKLSDGSNSNYWFDLKIASMAGADKPTEAFFHEVYASNQCGPYSLFYYAANDPAFRDLLVGCKDGHIRKFDKTAKSDVKTDDSTQLIDSYVVLGPLQLSEGMNDGTLSNINIVSAGGESDGGESDSDDIDFSVFAARTSENIIEDVTAAASKLSGTFSSPGYQKGNRDRRKVRGRFGAVKIGNDTAAETWGFEKLT
ncbi:hypothetical protein KAR91_35895, partial [Candidatus Pacearchaeota archaeon]|nr:hypothetical protein [Candidatus Pacearchaeota archaeon]